jgi:hypothetical protein
MDGGQFGRAFVFLGFAETHDLEIPEEIYRLACLLIGEASSINATLGLIHPFAVPRTLHAPSPLGAGVACVCPHRAA